MVTNIDCQCNYFAYFIQNPEINYHYLSKCTIELQCSVSLQYVLQCQVEIFENFMNEVTF